MHDAAPYVARTGDLTVRVRPSYLAGQSDPAAGRWTWAYHIEIENGGTRPVQLLSRHWIITDGSGHVEEVKGPGVIGQQPVLAPGESFTYTSGCSLGTAFGKMEGTYQMTTRNGDGFDVTIAPFTLSEPYTVH